MDFGNLLGSILPALAGPGGFAGPMPGLGGGITLRDIQNDGPLPRNFAEADEGWRAAFDEARGEDPSIKDFDEFLRIQNYWRNKAGGMDESGALPGGVDLNAALARNARMGQQQRQRPPGTPSKFLNALGMIGDALAMWRGGQPLYSMRLKEQQAQARQQGINDALKNYLTDPDAAIAAVMEIDAPTGIQLAQSRQGKTPEEIALMRMVGIDPASDEGKEIIKSRLMGRGQSDPTFVRELEALGIDPSSDEARELYYGRNSPAGYLLKPRGRSQAPSLSPGKVVNGYRFKGGNPNDRNSWEAVGGPTPSASGPFPASGY